MSVEVLSAFVPSLVLQYLNSLPNLRKHRSHCENFEGVVMIADMSGFTKLSELLCQEGPLVATNDSERSLGRLNLPAHKIAAAAKLFRFSNRTERQSYGVSEAHIHEIRLL